MKRSRRLQNAPSLEKVAYLGAYSILAQILLNIVRLFVFSVIQLDAVLLVAIVLGLGMILASRLGGGYRRSTIHTTATIVVNIQGRQTTTTKTALAGLGGLACAGTAPAVEMSGPKPPEPRTPQTGETERPSPADSACVTSAAPTAVWTASSTTDYRPRRGRVPWRRPSRRPYGPSLD